MSYCPFHIFQGLWFPDKGSESTKARALVLLNLNNRSIEVVYIAYCFLLFSFKIAIRRDKKLGCNKCKFFTYFPLYLFKQKYFLIRYITKVVQNDKTIPMTPKKRGWPLFLGIYSSWKSLLNNSKTVKISILLALEELFLIYPFH